MSPTWYYNLLPSNLGDRLFIAVLIAAQICSDIYSFGNKEYFLLARRYVKSESVVCVCGEFLCLHGATFRAAGTRLLPLAAVIVMLPVSCSPMRCRGWLTASECPGTFPSRITPSPSHPFILSVVRLHYLVAGAKIIVIAPRTYPTSFNIIHAFHWKTLWVISTTSWEIDGKKCDSIRNVGVPQNPCRYFRAFCSNSERRGSIIQFGTELPLVLPRDFWLYCMLS